jgi:ribosomal protein S27E
VGGEEGRRRAPEKSVLLEAFRRGWAAVSGCVPSRVKQEAQRYLDCGQLRCGFVEVTCEACGESQLIAFSCKGRGWCPSCTARRAAETGAHLANVLPRVNHRQWTLSLPFTVRHAVVKQPRLLKYLERRLVKGIWRWQRQRANQSGHTGVFLNGGGVCFTQWFGSHLQLTPHLHLLVPEALWAQSGALVEVSPPSDADVGHILARTLRQAKKDWGDIGESWADDDFEVLQAQAIQAKLPLDVPKTRHRRSRVAVAEGFSLHADTAVHANDREGLERLARYGARGPIAECRLRKLEGELYEYTPKRGVTFTLTAADLVRRLVALVPPPKSHLTSFHGVYAPHSTLRPLVTGGPTIEAAPTSPPLRRAVKPKRQRLDWASLHQHTFGNDVLRCPCGGRRTIRALHSTHQAAEERLAALGRKLPSRLLPDATAPPQLTLAV